MIAVSLKILQFFRKLAFFVDDFFFFSGIFLAKLRVFLYVALFVPNLLFSLIVEPALLPGMIMFPLGVVTALIALRFTKKEENLRTYKRIAHFQIFWDFAFFLS